MSTRARSLVGLVLLLVLIFGGVALLQAGVYGWTIFVLFPLGVGALATWVLRPPTGARAAGLGAIAVAAATCSLLLLGLEGLLCVVMCLPLAMPLGALGDRMARLSCTVFESHSSAGHGSLDPAAGGYLDLGREGSAGRIRSANGNCGCGVPGRGLETRRNFFGHTGAERMVLSHRASVLSLKFADKSGRQTRGSHRQSLSR